MPAELGDGPRTARSAMRYPLTLQLKLDGGEGVTKDISATGVYFSCDRAVAADQLIEFAMQFDATPGERPMRLRCTGQVVRVEEVDGRVGVAAKILSYAMEETPESDR